jgi:hypothetical protein
MKNRYLIIFVFTLLVCVVRAQSNFTEYLEVMKDKEVASFDIDLNNDGKLDNIKFKFPTNSAHPKFTYSDPGVSNILEITLANSATYILNDAFDSLALPIRNNIENKIKSDLIYLTKPINGSNYLLISGPEYGCCFAKLFILKIEENKIEEVYSNEFDVTTFSYNSQTNKYIFTGLTFLGEMWDGYQSNYLFKTFNYEKVYSLSGKFGFDKEETMDLNKENISKYGDFLNFSNPVFVINKETKKEHLVDLNDEITYQYQRKYDDLSRNKMNSNYFKKFNKSELRLMRNEVFASYGYIFTSQDLKEYFASKKWYEPTTKNVDDKLTEIEKYNIQLILEAEKAYN